MDTLAGAAHDTAPGPARVGPPSRVQGAWRWLRDRLADHEVLLTDVALAFVAALVIVLRIAAVREPNARPLDGLAYGIGMALGAVLVARRRWPVGVLGLSALLITAYHWIGYPAIGVALPLAVALYTAAASGHREWPIGLSIGVIGSAFVWRAWFEHLEPVVNVADDTMQELLLAAAVVLLGDAVHTRRELSTSVRDRLRVLDAQREEETQRRMAEERLEIARDLHDVVAHAVTVIGVHADVAAEKLDDGDQACARDAVELIQGARREAMSELKATVGVLRNAATSAPRSPTPGLALLDELIAAMDDSGLTVDVARSGAPRPLSSAVDVTAYRIVQESLTNVLRHTSCDTVAVELRYDVDTFGVVVRNPPCRDVVPPDRAVGHGIDGMAERAAAMGGGLEARRSDDGGFVVTAWLPAPELP